MEVNKEGAGIPLDPQLPQAPSNQRIKGSSDDQLSQMSEKITGESAGTNKSLKNFKAVDITKGSQAPNYNTWDAVTAALKHVPAFNALMAKQNADPNLSVSTSSTVPFHLDDILNLPEEGKFTTEGESTTIEDTPEFINRANLEGIKEVDSEKISSTPSSVPLNLEDLPNFAEGEQTTAENDPKFINRANSEFTKNPDSPFSPDIERKSVNLDDLL